MRKSALADTILNFQLGGISGDISVFKRRPASHAPPVVERSEPTVITRDIFVKKPRADQL